MDHAQEYLRQLIEAARASAKTRLPTIAEMARDTGIPVARIHRAVRLFKNRGKLRVRRGAGIELVAPSPARTSEGDGTAAARTHSSLVRDLRQGVYAPSESLPNPAMLASRYEVHPDTIRKVLRRLHDEGWVRRKGVEWTVPVRRGAGSYTEHIALVGPGVDPTLALALFPGADALLTALNEESGRRRVELIPVHLRQDLRPPDSAAARRIGEALGVILWTYGVHGADSVARLATDAVRRQSTVSVLDQRALLPHDGHATGFDPKVRAYSVSQSEHDGADVARHVLQQGHRTAAFIAPYARSPWVQRRHRGCRRVFDQVGPDVRLRFMPIALNTMAEETSVLVEEYHDWLEAKGFPVQPDAPPPHSPHILAALQGTRQYGNNDITRRALEPVFEEALADRAITVWICVNDDVALHALHFLIRHGIKVPQDLSLVSFDDSRLAMHYRFSSYNFNVRGLVSELIDWLLHGNPERENGVVRRVPGFVHDRGTVARLQV